VIHQLVLRIAGGGLKSFSIEGRDAAILRAEAALLQGEAASAVVRDRGGVQVWPDISAPDAAMTHLAASTDG
jgi:hypothetical protein